MSDYRALTTVFCSTACQNTECLAYPSEERLKQAKVACFFNLQNNYCGYVPIVRKHGTIHGTGPRGGEPQR